MTHWNLAAVLWMFEGENEKALDEAFASLVEWRDDLRKEAKVLDIFWPFDHHQKPPLTMSFPEQNLCGRMLRWQRAKSVC